MIEVQYINHMGDDLSVVNAARVSFGKHKDLMDKSDINLIHYLAKHNHKSPFNHAFATFHVKAPIFVARQLQKHEYMPWNEISRRYVDSEPEFYEPEHWRGRSADKKQGSEGVVKDASHLLCEWDEIYGSMTYIDSNKVCLEAYNELLCQGVAPEQARMVLPQSMMTEWYWSGSLYAFAKMCSLRCSLDTQFETQLVALEIENVMLNTFPTSWKSLMANL